MPIFKGRPSLWIITLAAIPAYGCTAAPDDADVSYSGLRQTADAALVGPLENDESDAIVSWVDGQVVTDWASEIPRRQQAIDAYHLDADGVGPAPLRPSG